MSIKNIELELTPNPEEDKEIWTMPKGVLQSVTSSGQVPLITLPAYEEGRFPRIAIILSANEKEYFIHQDYVDAILDFDAEPYFIAYDNIEDQLNAIEPDGIMLIGGSFETPESWYDENIINEIYADDECANAYLEVLDYAKENKLPTLGICAGQQMIAGFEGCKLRKSVDDHQFPKYEYTHAVTVSKNSLLHSATLQEEFKVNSSHLEVVDQLSPNVKATAMSDDGLIEAIELVNSWNSFVLGVQWHPERLLKIDDESSEMIFQRFIEACI